MAIPETLPEVAVIVVDPVVTVVTKPPVAIVATAVLSEFQVTEVVRSFVVLSEKVPVAFNCWVAPNAIFGLAGVTVIVERVGLLPSLHPAKINKAKQ
ncbi:MAG: hypothetical protein WC799_02730 [Desulfobacteraceae bacterium]